MYIYVYISFLFLFYSLIDKQKIYDKSEFVYEDGSSSQLSEALRVINTEMFTSKNGDDSENANIAVLIVHDKFTDWPAILYRLNEAREKGIHLMVATHKLPSSPSNYIFNTIANDPNEKNIFRLPSIEDPNYERKINVEADKMVQAICNRKYILFYQLHSDHTR